METLSVIRTQGSNKIFYGKGTRPNTSKMSWSLLKGDAESSWFNIRANYFRHNGAGDKDFLTHFSLVLHFI